MKMNEPLKRKYDSLLTDLRNRGSVAVAYSAGVDSTLLLKAAKEALGDSAVAIMVSCESVPAGEVKEAREFCAARGIELVTMCISQLEIEGFTDNTPDRCYICKKALFSAMAEEVKRRGINFLAEGSNTDDDNDYRPGMRAVKELGVISPLKDAGLSKAQIREISEALDLPTWNKPAMACLATRIRQGEMISLKKLVMIEEAEKYLRERGYGQLRVRMHGDDLARIELSPAETDRLIKEREEVCTKLKSIGFKYISMDLAGYQRGSMN